MSDRCPTCKQELTAEVERDQACLKNTRLERERANAESWLKQAREELTGLAHGVGTLKDENTRLQGEVERLQREVAMFDPAAIVAYADNRVREANTPLKRDAALVEPLIDAIVEMRKHGPPMGKEERPGIGTCDCRTFRDCADEIERIGHNALVAVKRARDAHPGAQSDNAPLRKPCTVPSSVTGAACMLEDGHQAASAPRFHKYPAPLLKLPFPDLGPCACGDVRSDWAAVHTHETLDGIKHRKDGCS
jgi:hypothetical protein